MSLARIRFTALAAFVLASGLAAAETDAPKPAAKAPATTEIGGEVLGPASEKAPRGAPIAKAKVAVVVTDPKVTQRGGEPLPPATGETGPDGKFSIKGLPGTSFNVRVQAPGFAPFEVQDVGAGASLKVRLTPGLSLEGRVLDASARKPVVGVTVLGRTRGSRGMPEEMLPQTLTDAEGRFRLGDLAPGVLDVEARGPTWARATQEGVAVPQRGSLELVVRPGGRLAGRVVGTDGKPIEGVSVRVEPTAIERMRDVMRIRPARTDAKGAFAFDGLQAGDSYCVSASKKGLSRGSAGPFAIQPGTAKEDLELKLDASASLKFRLLDPEENPVPAVDVELYPQADSRGPGRGTNEVPEDQVVAEGEGRFRVTGLTTGTATLELVPDGFASIERKDVKLEAGKAVDLGTLTAREGHTLRGRVADATGAPVQGAMVRGFWMGDGRFHSRQVSSGTDGRFRMSGLGQGTLQTMMVSAKGFANKMETGISTDQEVDVTLDRAGAIVGRVLLEETRDPVPAKVEATAEAKADTMPGMRLQLGFNEDEYADASGNFRVDDLEPGKYTLIATLPGKAPARVSGLEVRAEDVADAGILLVKEGLSLRGRVLDVKDDSPIPGAAVSVDEPRGMMRFGLGDASARATMSDAQGGFEVAGLEAKTYEVAVQHPDFARADARAEVKEGAGTPEVVVRLSRGGVLTGTVRDAQRQPVPAASVMVMQGMGGSLQSATSGEDGVYRLERLAPGSYRAMRVPDGNRIMVGPGMKAVEIKEGEVSVLDFDDAAKITLTGRVLRGDRPVPGAMLIFLPGESFEAPPTEMKTTQSETDGRFQIGLDRAGVYTVVVQGMGDYMTRATTKVQVQDQPQVSQDVVLSTGAISGVVTGPDNQPVASAVVQATPDPPPAQTRLGGSGAQTKADGAYRIEGLEPGSYKVRAMAPGRKPAEATATVGSEGGAVRIDLRLESGRSLRGRVVDPQGNGLQGAFVLAAPVGAGDHGAGMSGTTDVNGAFEIIAPADGPLEITGIARGYAPARASGVVASDDEDGPGITLMATSGGRIRIQVVGTDGAARPGVQPVVRAEPGFLGSMMANYAQQQRSTDVTGTLVVDSLSPATYVVSVPNRSDVPAVTVQVAEGSEAVASLRVP